MKIDMAEIRSAAERRMDAEDAFKRVVREFKEASALACGGVDLSDMHDFTRRLTALARFLVKDFIRTKDITRFEEGLGRLRGVILVHRRLEYWKRELDGASERMDAIQDRVVTQIVKEVTRE